MHEIQKDFLSVAEVRRILGVSRLTVYGLIKSGRLKAIKLNPARNARWLISQESLLELLKPNNQEKT